MKYGGRTDVGIKRKSNQDSYAVFSDGNYFCAVVCDGMGGAKGGNVASGLAVKTFSANIKNALAAKNASNCSESTAKLLLRESLIKANQVVYQKSLTGPEFDGMGTTLVAVLVCKCGTFAVNVGDSRLYRQINGAIEQVSKDHSFVQYLIDKGELSPENAANHPNKNIILRALGVNDQVEGDYFSISEYDRLLLCSDGLTNHVSNTRISEIISGNYSVKPVGYKERVDMLIEEANAGGGLDNITAVLFGLE